MQDDTGNRARSAAYDMQVIDLIAGTGRLGRLAGFDVVERTPPEDLDNVSALTAARLVVHAIGTIVRQV